MKQCAKCGVRERRKDDSYCKTCRNDYGRRWCAAHRTDCHVSLKQSRDKLKERAFVRLGSKCKHCGMKDMRCLQVDHINGGGSKENKSIGSQGIYNRITKGAKGYQLLCANCNWIKRWELREYVK